MLASTPKVMRALARGLPREFSQPLDTIQNALAKSAKQIARMAQTECVRFLE